MEPMNSATQPLPRPGRALAIAGLVLWTAACFQLLFMVPRFVHTMQLFGSQPAGPVGLFASPSAWWLWMLVGLATWLVGVKVRPNAAKLSLLLAMPLVL